MPVEARGALAVMGPAEGERPGFREGWSRGRLGLRPPPPALGRSGTDGPPPGPHPRSGPHGEPAATTAQAGGARTASGREGQGGGAKNKRSPLGRG